MDKFDGVSRGKSFMLLATFPVSVTKMKRGFVQAAGQKKLSGVFDDKS